MLLNSIFDTFNGYITYCWANCKSLSIDVTLSIIDLVGSIVDELFSLLFILTSFY